MKGLKKMKVRLFLMAALLMAVAAQMDAQKRKSLRSKYMVERFLMSSLLLKRNIFWGAKSPENGIHSYVTILIPMM